MNHNFAAFILTHGRPDNVKTYTTLRKGGYTGPIYLIVDNEDSTIDRYRENYGAHVVMFDKAAIAETFDEADNFNDRRAIVYARNACYDIAESLGYDLFLQLDDDYTGFYYKFAPDLSYRQKLIRNLDDVFDVMLDYYQSTPLSVLAFGQAGDYLGGAMSGTAKKIQSKRKAMNSLFCSVNRRVQFLGRVNEDVNTYVTLGNRGILFLTIMQVSVIQTQTQANPGGMSDLYRAEGTYRKSFYTVMYAPSAVEVAPMGNITPRWHHRITWPKAVPRIVPEHVRRA
jgi:hypothetical protein